MASPESIRRAFDRNSKAVRMRPSVGRYTTTTKVRLHYEPYWQQQLQPAQDRLLATASLEPDERVLDVACGTGLVSLPAAQAVAPGGEVLGVDISEGMIKLARSVAGEQRVGNVSFERREAEALDLPDDSFDAALCSLGLMYMPDPVHVLREVRRAIIPEGRAVATVWGRRDRCGWADVFPIIDRRVASDVCPLFFQLGTGDALVEVFRAAGFVKVTFERFSTVLHYDSFDAVCTAIFEAGAVALAYRQFDDATRKAVRADYQVSIEPYRDGNGYNIPGEFVLARGFKDRNHV